MEDPELPLTAGGIGKASRFVTGRAPPNAQDRGLGEGLGPTVL